MIIIIQIKCDKNATNGGKISVLLTKNMSNDKLKVHWILKNKKKITKMTNNEEK